MVEAMQYGRLGACHEAGSLSNQDAVNDDMTNRRKGKSDHKIKMMSG